MTMETNKNIEQLLEMLDHPEAYSEQEIMDIINRDDETRETYRQLVQAKRAGNHHHIASQPIDLDEAWQRFESQYLAQPKQERLWKKIAAILAGIVLMTGITWAAVHTIRQTKVNKAKTEMITDDPSVGTEAMTDKQVVSDTTITETTMVPVTFDNVPLDQMLTEIADYYGLTIEIQNDDARNLRFHFVWNKEDGLAKVLEDLSHFDSVNIEQTDDKLIVR